MAGLGHRRRRSSRVVLQQALAVMNTRSYKKRTSDGETPMTKKTSPKTTEPVKPAVSRTDTRDPQADRRSEPQLPHEADESASNQHTDTPQNVRIGRQAKADIDRGLVDTDRGPVVDKLYRREFDPEHTGRPVRK